MLADDGSSHRGLFLIDKKGIVRHQLVNDEPLGRSVDEAVRMLDALQYFEKMLAATYMASNMYLYKYICLWHSSTTYKAYYFQVR